MTQENIAAFVSALAADDSLAKGLKAAIDGIQRDGAVQAISEYAAARGYPVTTAEIEALMSCGDNDDGAMSDRQLDAVAGGIPPWFEAEGVSRLLGRM